MIIKTNIEVDSTLIDEAIKNLPSSEFRFSLNNPTDNFFYDPWVIKDEFKDTVWDKILKSLPKEIGEARIIILKPGTCYFVHADIDDRYHLNLIGSYSYLVDLEENQVHRLERDNIWYDMDASGKHSAANFGLTDRVQLVVRKLLLKNKLYNPVSVTVTSVPTFDARFLFDETISTWLNQANKRNKITNFFYKNESVFFDIENDEIESIKKILPIGFSLEVQ